MGFAISLAAGTMNCCLVQVLDALDEKVECITYDRVRQQCLSHRNLIVQALLCRSQRFIPTLCRHLQTAADARPVRLLRAQLNFFLVSNDAFVTALLERTCIFDLPRHHRPYSIWD